MNLTDFPKHYFGTIISDNPWPERGGGKIKRGADKHYPVMTIPEMVAMGPAVQSIAAPDCHLYFWVTNNYLEKAFEVIKAWGFKYVTTISWEKQVMGLGQYFRGTTEHVLFCKRGQPKYRLLPDGRRAQGKTGIPDIGLPDYITEILEEEGAWFLEHKRKHSKKPDLLYTVAEKVSHGPYLELFARQSRPGWQCWGNEAPKSETL